MWLPSVRCFCQKNGTPLFTLWILNIGFILILLYLQWHKRNYDHETKGFFPHIFKHLTNGSHIFYRSPFLVDKCWNFLYLICLFQWAAPNQIMPTLSSPNASNYLQAYNSQLMSQTLAQNSRVQSNGRITPNSRVPANMSVEVFSVIVFLCFLFFFHVFLVTLFPKV